MPVVKFLKQEWRKEWFYDRFMGCGRVTPQNVYPIVQHVAATPTEAPVTLLPQVQSLSRDGVLPWAQIKVDTCVHAEEERPEQQDSGIQGG